MADRFLPKQEAFLLKLQADGNTAQTSLGENDFVEALEGSTSEIDIPTEEVSILSGVLDQEAAVPGTQSAPCTLIFPLRSWGNGIEPDFMKVFRCADFAVTENNGFYIATPSSAGGSSATIWHYSGKSGTTNLHKLTNWKCDWKISGEVGKMVKVEFTGKGAHSAWTTGTIPELDRIRARIPAFLSATILINGMAYKPISFEISGNQPVEQDLDGTTASGFGQSDITDRKIKMTCKVYMDLQSTIDPIANLKAQTSGAIQLYWDNSNIKIDGAYSQIVDAKKSDQNGKSCWDLTLQLNRNSFQLRVAGGESSSSSSSSSSSTSY